VGEGAVADHDATACLDERVSSIRALARRLVRDRDSVKKREEQPGDRLV
jgi:hypothetical protein